MRIGEVKSAAAWQAKFQGAERLVTVISEPIYRFNLNKRLRSGDKLNANFLFFDGVARTESRRAASRAICYCREYEDRGETRVVERWQGFSIVPRESGVRKNHRARMLAANWINQRGLRPWTRTKLVLEWLRTASR